MGPGLGPIGPQKSSHWLPPDVCLSDRPQAHRLGQAGVPVVTGGLPLLVVRTAVSRLATL